MCNPVAIVMGVTAVAGLFAQQDNARRSANQMGDARKEAQVQHDKDLTAAADAQQRADKLRKRDMKRAAAASLLPPGAKRMDSTINLSQGAPETQRKTLLGS